MTADHKCSIVIIGGGFAGIAAAKAFSECCRGGLARATVIDKSAFHVFTPLLYEAATAFVEHENIGTAKLLGSGVAVDCVDLFAKWNVDFMLDEVTGIDWDKREVQVRSGANVPFEYLVIATGAEMNYFGIPGLKENACVLKTATDADKLRQKVHNLLHRRESGKQKTLDIVIGGGGPTGVELAAELTMLMRRHVLRGHLDPNDFRISIVEASSRVLGALDPKLSAAALERLRALGVRVYRDTAIKEAGEGQVTLAPRACKPGETPDQLLCDFTKDGSKTLPADVIVWCGGIRGSSMLEKLGLPLDERGKRIPVNEALEVQGRENVYAVGDCALLVNPVTKLPAPWLAQAAMAHGDIAARRIIAKRLGGDMPTYGFPHYPVVIPLGGKYCLAVAFGRVWSGFPGWVIHELATLRYFLSIMPPLKAVRHWWNGAVIFAGND
jgi:NADH:ubiquinone reductase (H+-translocating)